jgi:hypothetical protein
MPTSLGIGGATLRLLPTTDRGYQDELDQVVMRLMSATYPVV